MTPLHMFSLFIILVLTLFNLSTAQRPLGCGFVYDGDTNGRFDLDQQSDTNTISANWFGFDENVVVKSFEVALITDTPVNSVFFWEKDGKRRCRDTQGFSGTPNVHDWIKFPKDTSSVTLSSVDLEIGVVYYFVVKAIHEDGSVVYSNSDGILITPRVSDDPANEERVSVNIKDSTQNSSDLFIDVSGDILSIDALEDIEVAQNDQSVGVQQTFSSNDKMRFERSFRGLGYYLTELYGPPVFAELDPNRLVLLDTITHESSSGLTDGEIAGIVIAVVFFFLLLLLLLLLVFFKSRSKDNKFQTTLYTDQDVENIDTDYKAHRQREKDSVSSTSKVEFPDTHIRRLSIGNARDLDVEEETPQEGKRGAMVLDSQTSSLRDYRKNV